MRKESGEQIYIEKADIEHNCKYECADRQNEALAGSTGAETKRVRRSY